MKNHTLAYLEALSAGTPTPGGGNASAVAGAISASLGMMVINLTLGKPKYAEFESDLREGLEQLTSLREEFLQLSEADNAAFDEVMLAFKLPKSTPEENALRKAEVQKATIKAAQVPAQAVKTASEMIPILSQLIEKGNRNSLSDTGVALQYLEPCISGALYNVMINCSSVKDSAESAELLQSTKLLAESALAQLQLAHNRIKEAL
ncbi:MAG: cyclodeaminase/cyclohydrolase family protein [Ignavibacteriaceae bacterium]|nr:cyclodeaminase/cyclohydrolase family protein [Ignavibacteriaceae bacterium]